jgi:hypothetical protein
MKVVYKYKFSEKNWWSHENYYIMTLPKNAQVINVGVDNDNVYCLWAIVDTEAEDEERFFEIYATGQNFRILPRGEVRRFIGTIDDKRRELFWHVFEVETEAGDRMVRFKNEGIGCVVCP